MDSNRVYSASLKRMLGFKIFPTINPEQVLYEGNRKVPALTEITEFKKTDEQIKKIKN